MTRLSAKGLRVVLHSEDQAGSENQFLNCTIRCVLGENGIFGRFWNAFLKKEHKTQIIFFAA